MSPDSRGLRCAGVLAAVAGLSLTTESQGQKALTTDHYAVVTGDGADADLTFARRWLDAAEKLMASKYHVVPDGIASQ